MWNIFGKRNAEANSAGDTRISVIAAQEMRELETLIQNCFEHIADIRESLRNRGEREIDLSHGDLPHFARLFVYIEARPESMWREEALRFVQDELDMAFFEAGLQGGKFDLARKIYEAR